LTSKIPSGFIGLAEELGAWSINPSRNADASAGRRGASSQAESFRLHVNEPKEIALMKTWGVDGVFTIFLTEFPVENFF